MRVVFHVVFGAIAGFALGVLGPLALFAFMSWQDPQNMRQGGGTVFPFLILLAAPLGAVYGALWGYERANPPKTIILHGPGQVLADFDSQFGHRSLEEQRAALAEIAPLWMAEYRRWVNVRLVVIALLSVAFLRNRNGVILWLVLCGGYALRTIVVILRVRAAIGTVRERWGDDAVDRLGLHWTLRTLRG